MPPTLRGNPAAGMAVSPFMRRMANRAAMRGNPCNRSHETPAGYHRTKGTTHMVEVGQRAKSQWARRTRRARRQRLAVDGLAGAVVLTGFTVGMVNVSGASSGDEPRAKSVKVSTTTIKNVGTVLTTASGLTLYRFTEDPMGKSVCTGACAKIWPPLTACQGRARAGSQGSQGPVADQRRPRSLAGGVPQRGALPIHR